MAKMHSRKRGKAGSKKPANPAKWVTYKPNEVARLVVKLKNEGKDASEIGMILRDQYGVPSVKDVAGKTVMQILKENNLLSSIPEDLLNLLKKSVNLKEHMGKNKKDYTSKHGLELLESKIRRLIKYYVRNKKLPAGFKYEPEKAKLLVETTKQ
jgi:small subunit ribosomal protein S15